MKTPVQRNNVFQMTATKQYFPVVLFIARYKMILPFESVDEILKRENTNERY